MFVQAILAVAFRWFIYTDICVLNSAMLVRKPRMYSNGCRVSPLVTIMRANKVQLQLVLLLLLYATSWIRCYICTTVQRTSVTLLSLTSNTLRQQNKFDLFPIFALLLHLFALPLWHCALFRNFRLCYRRDASSFQIPTKFHCDLL